MSHPAEVTLDQMAPDDLLDVYKDLCKPCQSYGKSQIPVVLSHYILWWLLRYKG